MLYSVALKLSSLDSAPVARPNGYHVYTLLLFLLRRVNPRLAQRLHEMNGPKPFTTSLLPGRGLPRHGQALSPRSGDLWLRFTILEDEAFSSLVESVWSLGQEQPLELGDGRYRCTLLATTPVQSPWACCTPFESLLEDAPDDPRATLRFLSLTTFRSSGHRNVLFPDPSLVFGSLLARWNAFAPMRLDSSSYTPAFSRIRPVYYRLRTGAMGFGSYEELGFQGTCAYALDAAEPPELRRAVQALSLFAFYSGVGVKTAMGMGQCRKM